MIDLHPSEFYLGQNYPNPFTGQTTIKYCVACRAWITLDVCSPGGEIIRRLVDEEKAAGTYEVIWDATSLPKGKYVCQMSAAPLAGPEVLRKVGMAGKFSQTKKLILGN